MTTVAITCSRSLGDHRDLDHAFYEARQRLVSIPAFANLYLDEVRWIHGDAPKGDRDLVPALRRLSYNVATSKWTIEAIPPDYDKYPPHVAPLERNTVLVERADALIAIWKPPAPGARKKGGTFDTICKAAAKGIPVVVEVLS